MRLTGLSAIREIGAVFLPRLALVAMSASTKNLRAHAPAQRLGQRTGIAVHLEQRIVTAIGIGLQNAGELFRWLTGCSCRRSREA